MTPRFSYSDDGLLAQCNVETFRASGPGGQNVNRRETAVRLRHRPSGIVVTCQRERSQYRNKMLALEELRERLAKARRRRKPRIPTAISAGTRARILEVKKIQSQKKIQRRKPVH